MDEERQQDEQAAVSNTDELEGLIALIEARVVEHLTLVIERLAQERGQGGTPRPGA